MKKEELFLAIGAVEEARLARSELWVPSVSNKEDSALKRKPTKVIRNLLIAAVVISMLAVTAYAVTGFLIFGSPEEMITAIFGDDTGFDHGVYREKYDSHGHIEAIEPDFDRIEADPAVVEEMTPHVDAVGNSISSDGYTLTVDAFMYDSATKCGFVTYLLENPNGVSGYKLQTNGEIWYDGAPDPVQVNLYGYPHIIQEKTTATCLAATYYFRDTEKNGEELILSLPFGEEPMTDAEINEIILMLDAKIRESLTPEEAVQKAKDTIGEAIFEAASEIPEGACMSQVEWDAERAYVILRDIWYHEEYEQKGPSIVISLEGEPLDHVTAENGAIVITPISFQLDGTRMDRSLLTQTEDASALVSRLTICFADGTEYEVMGETGLDNTIFKLVDSASGGREDVYGRYTCMFNRLVNVKNIESILLSGNQILID